MQEDQDTCRICSAPAEPDQPLFHPCKCSGTIRYIHQDCLTTWLNHSRKKTCDVCKYPYSFNKVYVKDMPAHLPALLVMRRFAEQSFFTVLFAIRSVLVAIVWLALLPWVTIWTWRMYFTMGDSTAWWISDRPRPATPHRTAYLPLYVSLLRGNATYTIPSDHPTSPFFGRLTSHPVWRAVFADIFSGQIIASLIVLTFVAVFLLREWVVQNARPGVFEEVEPPAPLDAAEVAPLPAELAPPPPDPEPIPARPPTPDPVDDHIPATPSDTASELSTVSSFEEDDVDDSIVKRERLVDRDVRIASTSRRLQEHSRELRTAALRNRREAFGSSGDVDARLQARMQRRSSSEPRSVGSSPSLLSPSVNESNHLAPMISPVETPQGETPRRPPLPGSGASSKGNTPLASPSLATYRAPEDLALAGPSAITGYFDEELAQDSAEIAAEHERYFQVPNDVEAASDAGSAAQAYDSEDFADLDTSESSPSLVSIESEDGTFDDEERAPESDDDDPDDALDQRLPEAGMNAVPDEDDAELAEDMVAPLIGVDEEDFDAMVDEENDMNGALEVIGFRGPIFGVFQNAALVIFVLDTVIGLGIWLPFTIGKSTALLIMDPPRLMTVLHFPIRVMRIFTDPVVDSVILITRQLILPAMAQYSRLALHKASTGSLKMIGSRFGPRTESQVLQLSRMIYNYTTYTVAFCQNAWHRAAVALAPADEMAAAPKIEASVAYINRFFESNSTMAQITEPYFATVGSKTRTAADHGASLWRQLALGGGTLEKLFAILLGYVVVGLILAFYLNILTAGSVRTAGRAIRKTIRQQLLIAKVGAFILFELIVFPLGCGIMLDVSSTWLFPGSSYSSRWAFFQIRPIVSVFYHWVAGTMFMYQFAILLSGCRGIMRPGAMWFIKDPQDQNFHPIRDILERPTLSQARKLFISAEMYLVVVAAGVGTVGGFLWYFTPVLPFRWIPRENLSEVPVDLLFLQLVLPHTIEHFRPTSDVIKPATIALWRRLSAELRLTSYMFGERPEEEEFTPANSSWSLLRAPEVRSKQIKDGSLRRVPANDQIALAPNMHGAAEVDEAGTPLTERARQLVDAQNKAAEKAGRSVKDDYTVVYFPPSFRLRVVLFVFALWMVGCVSIASAIAIPIVVGRQVFALFIDGVVHDGYSLFAGFYLAWGCYLLVQAFDALDKSRQRHWTDDGSPAPWALYVAKRSALWVMQLAYMALFLGVIIPTLVAMVVELYLILPIRFTLDSPTVPRMRVVDMWTIGLLYMRIGLRTQHARGAGRVGRGIDRILRSGWSRPDPWAATVEVILPVVGGLVGMLVFPGAVVWVLKMARIPLSNRFLLVHVYPSLFAVAGFLRVADSMRGVYETWTQNVRDSEFLVEMQLRNLEPEKPKEQRAATTGLDTPEDQSQTAEGEEDLID